MLPEVFGHVSLYLHRAQTPEKKQQKSVTMCTVSNNIENSRLNSYICPHSFTPLASNTQIPPRCGRYYIKETASVASIRLRGTVMAANRKTRHNNTVTSRQYGRRAIFVPGDVKFQDGDAFGLSKLGGGALSSTFTSFFQCFTCASLFRNKVHT